MNVPSITEEEFARLELAATWVAWNGVWQDMRQVRGGKPPPDSRSSRVRELEARRLPVLDAD